MPNPTALHPPDQEPPEAAGNLPGAELDHARILPVPINWLKPSPENEQLYRPVSPDDPDIIALAASIEADGVQEALVVTRDGWIISGHRRHVAAFNAEVDREKTDAARLATVRKQVLRMLSHWTGNGGLDQ